MAEADKLNIDSIIQRLLEGKLKQYFARYLFTEVAILANRLDNDSHLCYVSQLSSSFCFLLTKHRIWIDRQLCLVSSILLALN